MTTNSLHDPWHVKGEHRLSKDRPRRDRVLEVRGAYQLLRVGILFGITRGATTFSTYYNTQAEAHKRITWEQRLDYERLVQARQTAQVQPAPLPTPEAA